MCYIFIHCIKVQHISQHIKMAYFPLNRKLRCCWGNQDRVHDLNTESSSGHVQRLIKYIPYDALVYIGGLVQGRRNSIANAPELRLSWTNPPICDTLSQFLKLWLLIGERVQCVGLVAVAPKSCNWGKLVRNKNVVGVSLVYSIKWKHFPRYMALCAGNSPVTGEFPAQRPVTRSFDVSLICVWMDCWLNNREADDLRGHCTHYDVTVMATEQQLSHSMGNTWLWEDCHHTPFPLCGHWIRAKPND